jgi:tetratricopeptide (TPR) repeat protein
MMEVVPTSVTIPFAREAGPGSSEILLDGRPWTLADETQAGTVVRGAYYVLGDSLRISAEIRDEGSQTGLESIEVTWPATDPMGGMGEMRQRVLTSLALRFDPRMVEGFGAWFGEKLPRYEAYEAHMEATAVIFGLTPSTGQAYSLSLRAFELDSTFFVPLINAAFVAPHPRITDSLLDIVEAHRDDLSPMAAIGLEIQRTRTHGRLQDEYLASRSWLDQQQGFGQGLWNHGWTALRINRPHEAMEVLLQANPDAYSLRGEPGYWTSVVQMYHLLARHEEELEAAREGRERFPRSTVMVRNHLFALAALGRTEEVLANLDDLITLETGSPAANLLDVARELRAHGHPEAARQVVNRLFAWYRGRPPSELGTELSRYYLGATHYLAEEWDEAEALFAGIHAEELTGSRAADRRRIVHSVGYLGVIAARQGNREEALRWSEELAASDFPYINGYETLWRGRIASVLGDREEAMALLLEAHAQGRYFGWAWHRDPALESLRDYPPFQEFMRPKG